jgi:stress response protein SCP2
MKTATNTYFIPEAKTDKLESLMVANALMTELLPYKVLLKEDLFLALARLPQELAHEFARDILKEFTIGKLNVPLFKDWEQRTFFSWNEFAIQIFGYSISLTGNDMYDPGFMARMLDRLSGELTKPTYLSLATYADAQASFVELASANVSLDREAQSNLAKAARLFVKTFSAIPYIKSDEARVIVLIELTKDAKDAGTIHAVLDLLKCKASDVMRYASAKNGNLDYLKLPHDLKFQSLSWQERKAIITYLNYGFSFEKLSEAFGLNRGPWKKFFKHIHLFNQGEFNRFHTLMLAGMVSIGFNELKIPTRFRASVKELVFKSLVDITDTGNLAYRTFASRVETALASKNFNKIEQAIGNNTGYLLRNIGSISNAITKNDEGDFVTWVRNCLDKADIGVLFSILAIDVDAKFRVIDVKGDTIIQPADYSPILREIQGDIKRSIFKRFGFDGQVTVDEELRNRVVPFLSKNADLERGTKIKFKENLYLYFLCNWIQSKERRTDLDTSYVALDDNWRPETVYFGNQANSYIQHSGDLTDAPAPHGATEYGRIDLSAIPENVAYIVPIINVYSGDVFSANESAYAGFMFSDSPQFDIRRDHVRYDLTQPANANIPFIIDVKNQEVVIVDFNNRTRLGATAHSEIENMKKLISATKSKKVVTMGVLADILSGGVDSETMRISEVPGLYNVAPDKLSGLFNNPK